MKAGRKSGKGQNGPKTVPAERVWCACNGLDRHWAQYFIILVFSLDMIGYGGIAPAVGSALVVLFPSLDIQAVALGADSRRV
jgi:hypothetical protein